MTSRPLAVAALVAWAWAAPPVAAQFNADGRRAYDMARAAEEAATLAQAEGAALVKRLQTQGESGRETEAAKALHDEATGAFDALTGYRKLAQESASEAFRLLAELNRGPAADTIRREVIEQRALLAAHEAAVMAARARTEAERLRAVAAEARLSAATTGPAASARGDAARPPAPGREIEVPNLVGARLEAVVRELAVLGLRLGSAAGPRDGFVVKQVPAAGTRVARQAAVSVTLSATAAGAVPITPR
jgi:hypothetical protein